MSAAKGIRAGKAYVEAHLDTSKVGPQLSGFKDKLNSFASGLRVLADSLMIGERVLSPIKALMNQFIEWADALWDTAAATSISVESLSLLGTIAQRSGGDIKAVAKAVSAMNRNLFGVAGPSKKAEATLSALGLSLAELQAMNPEQRFTAIAQALSRVGDEGQLEAMATTLLGKGASDLLPFIKNAQNLNEEMERAKALGLGVSTGDAKIVDDFGDNLADVKDQLRAIGGAIARAVLPQLTQFLQLLQPILAGMINWMKANPGIVRAIFHFVAGAVAGGVALGVLASGFAAVMLIGPFLLPLLKAVLLGLGWVLGMSVTLGGVFAAGVGILHFLGYLDQAKAALWEVIGVLKSLWDAISSGNFKLAGEIAFAGLRLAWASAVDFFMSHWSGFVEFIRSSFESVIAGVLTRLGDAAELAAAVDPTGNLRALADELHRTPRDFSDLAQARQDEIDAASQQRAEQREGIAAELRALQAQAAAEKAKLAEQLAVESQQRVALAMPDIADTATDFSAGATDGMAAALLLNDFNAGGGKGTDEAQLARLEGIERMMASIQRTLTGGNPKFILD